MMAAFTAVKSGIAMGKEIHSLGKELGSLFDMIDGAKRTHNKKKSGRSANEEALETFVAKKQAEDLENQLRDIVIQTRGISAWQELVRLRADIRVRRQQEHEESLRRRDQVIEATLMWILVATIIGIVLSVGLAIYLARTGQQINSPFF
jgi:ABC-type phosphate transport system permease subunit